MQCSPDWMRSLWNRTFCICAQRKVQRWNTSSFQVPTHQCGDCPTRFYQIPCPYSSFYPLYIPSYPLFILIPYLSPVVRMSRWFLHSKLLKTSCITNTLQGRTGWHSRREARCPKRSSGFNDTCKRYLKYFKIEGYKGNHIKIPEFCSILILGVFQEEIELFYSCKCTDKIHTWSAEKSNSIKYLRRRSTFGYVRACVNVSCLSVRKP